MDYDGIVEPLLDRCKGFIESILHAPDLSSVASALLTIFAQMRHVARDILQAKITPEAQQRKRADVKASCPEAGVTYVHTRTVSPETLFGEITIPVRTFRCRGCGALFRPDDGPLGVPASGEFADDVRYLYAPAAAEVPHRVAKALFARGTGVCLSSSGGQGIIDRTADDPRTWQFERKTREAEAVAVGDGGAELRVEEIAMDGVMAHIDGRWQAAVERNRTRIRYQEPWLRGLAVGFGSVEGACKHVIESCFKRAGMRWN
jgi:hypothetical protein